MDGPAAARASIVCSSTAENSPQPIQGAYGVAAQYYQCLAI